MASAKALLASMMLERVRVIFMVADVWPFEMTMDLVTSDLRVVFGRDLRAVVSESEVKGTPYIVVTMLLEIQESTPCSITKTEMLAISCVHNLLACIANVALARNAEPYVSSWRRARATRDRSVYMTDYSLSWYAVP